MTPSVAISTASHLLNHTSGLREIFTYEEAGAAFDDLTRTRSQYHSFLRRIPSDFAPGSRWSYSNTNYALLALLVERLEGAPYEDVLVRRFFAPHGLGSLRQCQSLPQRPGEAFGHVLSNGAAAVAAPENMEWIRGDGGLCGNALDVARWSRLLATGRILPASGYERMTARTRVTSGPESDYGFGLSLVPLDGIRKVSHNGAMRGFSASAAYYPDSALTVVVLTNRGDVRTESIERAIARVLLGLPAPSTESIALTEAEATRYVGTFDIGVFHIRIRQREGGMWLEMPPPGPTTRLVYRGYGRFVGAGDPDATVVTFSSSGQMVTLFMGAMNWTGTRRAEQP
jgi:D-alanyl-D-alanine carboxypeptidase